MSTDRAATLNVRPETIADLKGHPQNYNRHSPQQLAELVRSIRRHGAYKNVVVSADGYILAGHGILEAARREGYKQWPCERRDYDHDHPDALNLLLTDNEVGNPANPLGPDPDQALLAALARQVNEATGLAGTGLDDARLAELLASLEPEPPPLEDPGPGEPPKDPVTKPGDVWIMRSAQGMEHRLVCGDALREDVFGLAVHSPPDVVWTDPPYGVDFHGVSVKTEDIAGDTESIGVWLPFVDLVPNETPLYICCNWRSYPPLWYALKEHRREVAEVIVWDKTDGKEHVHVPPAALGRWIHSTEFIAYCGRLREDFGWSANVIHHPRACAGSSRDGQDALVSEWDGPLMSLHPTVKPLEIVEKCLGAHKSARTTCDPFVGSGTTVIACERMGRAAFAIEIEPRYCDVTVQRWCRATKQPAILESTGVEFPIPEEA